MNRNKSIFTRIFAVALCAALVAFCVPFVLSGINAQNDDGTVIIVLDPGHGGSDVGAVCSSLGLYEADVNLDIAIACYNELMRYDGVEVYMTRGEMDFSQPKVSLNDRVRLAGKVGADILVSIHCNDSENLQAHGSEVFVSHSTYDRAFNQDSTQLAILILRRFKDMGMTIRGVKTKLSNGSRMYYHDDGSVEVGDYFAVIGDTINCYGIPGILIEHGFMSGDSARLSDPEQLRQFGIADATALAEFYGLRLSDSTATPTYQPEEPVAATSEDIIAAARVEAKIVSIPEDPSRQNISDLRDVKELYENLTAGAKTCLDSGDVDFLYHSIIELDYINHPVRIVAKDESTVTVNRIDGTVEDIKIAAGGIAATNASGLASGMEWYIDNEHATDAQRTRSDYRILVCDSEGTELDIAAPVTTGCIVRLVTGSGEDVQIIDELFCVCAGDIDGDGKIDSFDQLILDEYLYTDPEMVTGDERVIGEEGLSPAQRQAADVNGDGRIDPDDIAALAKVIIELG